MAFLNDLVRQVREQHGLSLEGVAAAADLSITSIHRYEQGDREVSLRYYRSLFSMTGDRRLLQYFSPPLAEAVCSAAARQDTSGKRRPPPGDPKDLLSRELIALAGLTKAAQYIETIVADGLVDESDHQAVLHLQRKHEEVRAIMDAADRALVAFLEDVNKS